MGAALVQEIESLQHLAPFIRYHHEYYNGRGYPDGLAGKEIPLEARILGVADAVEAMASDRPYRQALTGSDILLELQTHSGSQFDPMIVNAFTRVINAQGETLIVNSARTISRIIEEHSCDPVAQEADTATMEQNDIKLSENPVHSELDSMNIPLQRAIAAHRRMEVNAQEGRDLAETLLKIATTINMTLDHNRVLTVILEQLAYVMDYDNASIMLLDGTMLNSVARRSIHVSESQSLSVLVQKLGHIQEVIEGQRAVVISDTHDDPRWMRRGGSEQIRCWLGIPLMVQNHIIGLMNLSNGVPGYYTERHVQVATAFAAHAAIAIENARLFTQAQNELAERQRAEEALRQSQEHLQAELVERMRAERALQEERALLAQRVDERTRELKTANEQLTSALRTKDEFLATMSHELRTP
ncbi:MAG: GAF domain-containing protein, partial [Caldilineaceae bacterium]|nr:GAF domain-containing protein [Caldilineaceae bacterium]